VLWREGGIRHRYRTVRRGAARRSERCRTSPGPRRDRKATRARAAAGDKESKTSTAEPHRAVGVRLGSLRVFYDVSETGRKVVHILAIGKKVRKAVRIGGQEIKL
jgi:hypothetical protein